MPRVQPKAMPNWCLQVKPDEPWTRRCGKEKIAADGKRIGATKRRSTPTPCMPASAVWRVVESITRSGIFTLPDIREERASR
jgi:hypothetical protein